MQLNATVGTAMGNPVECEHASPDNGDILQQTTTGLAVYRQSSSMPTFTNGSEHWAFTNIGVVFWMGDSLDPTADAQPLYPQVADQAPPDDEAVPAQAPAAGPVLQPHGGISLEEQAYLMAADNLFTGTLTVADRCQRRSATVDQQSRCVVTGDTGVVDAWRQTAVPPRYATMHAALGLYLTNGIADLQTLNKMAAEVAGGDGTWDPLVVQADHNAEQRYSAAANSALQEFAAAFILATGYKPGLGYVAGQ